MNAHAERLRGIVDALEVQDLLPLSRKHIRSAANEIERLQAQVEELQKDKARLDWIEKHRVQLNCLMGAPGNFHYSVGSWSSEHSYRVAIDKRMEQTK